MKVIEMPKRINQDVVDILEKWLVQAKNGELETVSLVGYRTDNSWQTGASSTDNNLRDCAMLMELAIRRMGYAVAGPNKWWQDDSDSEEFAALVAAHEREACERLVWDTPEPDDEYVSHREAIAAAIRARGEA